MVENGNVWGVFILYFTFSSVISWCRCVSSTWKQKVCVFLMDCEKSFTIRCGFCSLSYQFQHQQSSISQQLLLHFKYESHAPKCDQVGMLLMKNSFSSMASMLSFLFCFHKICIFCNWIFTEKKHTHIHCVRYTGSYQRWEFVNTFKKKIRVMFFHAICVQTKLEINTDVIFKYELKLNTIHIQHETFQ